MASPDATGRPRRRAIAGERARIPAARPGAWRLAPLLLAAGCLLAGWGAPAVLAASPTPSALPVGDPRSAGQGPGLVGDPLFALAAVAAIGLLALAATLAYVRATGGPRGS